ncbi:hypothetical protein [Anaerosporobacter sp.]|uniref:hypothetical protein n=1 Tax=Anaerosporobacter sp. TaxID=1872529 RepID=UPI00286F8483|nr:hypothetical protein [Anaerosporobacter sp.]
MKDAGFEKGRIPKKYLNKILSGESSWNANPKLRDEAREIADKMKENPIKCNP